jgi:hypothetical protein
MERVSGKEGRNKESPGESGGKYNRQIWHTFGF